MEFKNLFTTALLLALAMPLSVLAYEGKISFYIEKPSKTYPPACGAEDEYLADYYIALNEDQFDADRSGVCGKCIKIIFENKYLVGRLVDRCPGCGEEGLDISPDMFSHFAHTDTGILKAKWEYVSCDNYGKKGSCSGSDCGMSPSSPSKDSTLKSGTVTSNASLTTKPVSTTTKAKATTTSKKSNSEVTEAAEAETNVEKVINVDENTTKGDYNVVIPLTGILMVSGAAGVGLLYATKSSRTDVRDLKKKFPEAFKSIKRSFTQGSSIRRKVTSAYGKKKPHLPTTTNDITEADNVNNNNTNSTGPEMDISETRININ